MTLDACDVPPVEAREIVHTRGKLNAALARWASVGWEKARSAVPMRRDGGTAVRVGFASLSPPYAR